MRLHGNQQGIGHTAGLLLLAVLTITGLVGWRVYNTNRQGSYGEQSKEFGSWEQRISSAFEPSDCQGRPELELYPGSYTGPLHDAHFHPASIPDGDIDGSEDYSDERLNSLLGVNLTFDEVLCTFKNDGTSGEKLLSFFPIYPNIYEQAVEVARRAVNNYPGVFVPFIMPPDDDGSPDGYPTVNADTLDKMLSVEPGLFKGYGEIGLYERTGGAKALSPDSDRLQAIYPVLRKHGVNKVYFHLGQNQADGFQKVLKANRDMTFIFHGDQLITQNRNGTQDLSQIDEILSNNPNVYYGVDELWGDVFLLNEKGTKEKVLNHFKDYEPLLKKDLETWELFITKHQDRVLWDSDRGSFRYTLDVEVGRAIVRYVRAFIGRLDPSIQEKYAYKNAERAYAD